MAFCLFITGIVDAEREDIVTVGSKKQTPHTDMWFSCVKGGGCVRNRTMWNMSFI